MTQPLPSLAEVEVRRSRRRTRTVTAFRENGRIVVAIPARFTAAQEREWVEKMLGRLEKDERRRRPSDEGLATRAAQLSARYLEGIAQPTSVAWVTNQNKRWGSCTPSTGEIRISAQLRGVPEWVLDSVLVHELAHLIEANHTPAFRALTARYPRTSDATIFLAGITWARNQGLSAGEQTGSNGEDGDID